MAFLIQGEVTRFDHALTRAWVGFPFLPNQLGGGLIDRQVHVSVVFCLPADDQRCARFIDQDGVHFIDDGVAKAALHTVRHLVHHVVAQIIKAEFVICTIRNVGTVCGLFFLPWHLRQIHAYNQSQEVVQPSHPQCVTTGKIIIYGHDVNAIARQRIQVDREGCCQGFALTSAHLGYFPVMQRHTTQKLHIKVPHLHHSF